jgi:hypothetical protein
MWQKDLGKNRNVKKERRRQIMIAERTERTQEKAAQKTRRWGDEFGR